MSHVRKATVLSVRDLIVGFGHRVVLNQVSPDVGAGEILGLVGGSGSGKSVGVGLIAGGDDHVDGRGSGTRRSHRCDATPPRGRR